MRTFLFVASCLIAFAGMFLVGCSTSVTPDAPPGAVENRNHASGNHGAQAQPDNMVSEASRRLYLTPGGLYTLADIEANGNMTAAEKFAGLVAAHNPQPEMGDRICPVTVTKANPKCTWIVGGRTYEFCCPPCVDEFVALAKSNPEEVKLPEQYVQGEVAVEPK